MYKSKKNMFIRIFFLEFLLHILFQLLFLTNISLTYNNIIKLN
jgi:hypothetical protein